MEGGEASHGAQRAVTRLAIVGDLCAGRCRNGSLVLEKPAIEAMVKIEISAQVRINVKMGAVVLSMRFVEL